MTRDEFFTALENGAKWDIGVAINRTNPVPIDANSVFKALTELQTYAETNPVAHPGQLVAVVGESETAAYIINTTGSGAQVSKLAASTAGDIGEAVSQLQTQVANIISGSQVVGKATSDANGNDIAATYATKATATTDAAGLMSAADKTKLDGIAAGAQANVIEGVAVQTTAGGGFIDASIVEKKVQLDLSNYATKQDLAAIPKFGIEVVDELPTEEISDTTIYLVPQEGSAASGQDIYDEYIYIPGEGVGQGKWELIGNTDIDLSNYSTTEQMNSAISSAVSAATADMATNAGVNAKLADYATTAAMNSALANKADSSTVAALDTRVGTTESEIDALQEQVATKVDAAGVASAIGSATIQGSQVNGAVASATTAGKVANALTFGDDSYDGSAAKEITAEKLGALTAVPQATTDALGGIKLGHVDSGEGDEYAVELDGEGKAFVTVPVPAVPDVPAYTAGDGISVTPNENDFIVAIAANGVTTDKIADGAVTDAKIAAVDVQKLYVAEGDSFILDGGNASTGSAAE